MKGSRFTLKTLATWADRVERSLKSGEVNIGIYADQSIIEVFVDDETCLTASVYPYKKSGRPETG